MAVAKTIKPPHYRADIDIGETGIVSFPVSGGKVYQIAVIAGGATYDVGCYLDSAENNPARKFYVSPNDAGMTTDLVDTTKAGFNELGINITVAPTSAMTLELLECKV